MSAPPDDGAHDPVALILSRVTRYTGGGPWKAACPAHDDKHPSLAIDRGRDGNAVLHCHAGCTPDDVIAALGLTPADLFPADSRRQPGRHDGPRRTAAAPATRRLAVVRPPHRPDPATYGRVDATYPYVDETGVLLYSKTRHDPKTFRVWLPDGTLGIGDVRRVLYRLPDVLAALTAGKVIWIVEGEKDADRLTALGAVATTNFSGAGEGKWLPEYTAILAGARIVIIADRDKPGAAHALAIHAALAGVAADVRITESATDGDHHDVTDHLDAGHTLSQLCDVDPDTLAQRYGIPHPGTADSAERDPSSESDEPDTATPAETVDPDRIDLDVLPDEVWEFSPQLAHIRTASMARLSSPDVALHAVLAIIASLLHHESRVDTGKRPSVLNHFLISLGTSGAGKSEALATARELLATFIAGHVPVAGWIDAPFGTGEGLCEAFMGLADMPVIGPDGRGVYDLKTGDRVTTQVRVQVKHNALFHTDEGRMILAVDARKGSTIMSVLCEIWSGTTTGQTNAEAARTRKLDAGTYTVGALLGFQPEKIDELFGDTAGGAPQRFLFASARWPGHVVEDVDWPGELELDVPDGPVTVTLSPEQRMEVRLHLVARARGEGDDGPLDGHVMLLRCRTAALLAVLHGQQVVDDRTWDLAGLLVAHSCRLRDQLAGGVERRRADVARARTAAVVEATVTSAQEVAHHQRVRMASNVIVRAVDAAGGELSMGRAAHTARHYRDVARKALALALSDGRLRVRDGGRRGDKVVYLPVREEEQ